MTNSFALSVDTSPPGNPVMVINGGVLSTAQVNASVNLSSAWHAGANPVTVTDMKIWGDVDLAAEANIQAFEVDSAWQAYTSDHDITLSAVTGRKRLYSRLRDSLGNETPVFGSYIDYNPALPSVSMVVAPLVTKVSLVAGHDEVTFSWECNLAFVHYEVRVMPTSASPYYGGSPLVSVSGSVNVMGTGSFPATTPITTTIKAADLNAASPGDGPKIIKVFVLDALGHWSP